MKLGFLGMVLSWSLLADCITIDPSADIYTMVQLFDQHAIRRLPVIAEQRVVGQVSRRDILTAIERTY